MGLWCEVYIQMCVYVVIREREGKFGGLEYNTITTIHRTARRLFVAWLVFATTWTGLTWNKRGPSISVLVVGRCLQARRVSNGIATGNILKRLCGCWYVQGGKEGGRGEGETWQLSNGYVYREGGYVVIIHV